MTDERRVTRRLVVDPQSPSAKVISAAAVILREGGLVAFPTETVYGLGAHALIPSAVKKLFAAKGRPAHNPIIVHVANAKAARALVTDWPATAERLARAFWPGPLTMLLPKREIVPDVVTATKPTVGVRVPAHPVALALLEMARIPVAAPSANRSSKLSPTAGHHVLAGLNGRIDVLLDAGRTPGGIESTVVDLTGPRPTILRPGLISAAEVARVTGPLGERAAAVSADLPLDSPGMMERHYAPRARLELCSRRQMPTRVIAEHKRPVGAVLLGEPLDLPPEVQVSVLPGDPRQYAALLYATLHELDDAGCRTVVVESVPEQEEWDAVRDRLKRAATE